MNTDLFGISDVAKALAVSQYTIRRLIEIGEIQAINIGARLLVPAAEVQRIARNGAGSPRRRRKSAPRKSVVPDSNDK